MASLLIDPLFDGTKAAGLYSALSGILAGFSFFAASTILTMRSGNLKEADRRGLAFLLMAFITLVVASYVWAFNAADTAFLPRTAYIGVGGTVALGLGALQMVCAINALLVDLETRAQVAIDILYVFVTLLVGLSFGNTFQESIAEATYSGPVVTFIPLIVLLVTGAVLFGERLLRRAGTVGSVGVSEMRHLALIGVGVCLALAVVFTFAFQPSSGSWQNPHDVPIAWRRFVLIGQTVIYAVSLLTLGLLSGSRHELAAAP